MSKVFWEGAALLGPVPAALVTCGTMEEPYALTIAWTGIVATHPPMTYISVRPTRHSYPVIDKRREFVINLTTAELCRKVDFCGVRSGETVDKFAACDWHLTPPAVGTAPILTESPLSLCCKVTQKIPLGSHDLFLAEIVSVAVEARYVDQKGKLNLQQCGLAAYAHGEYFALGRKLGDFGFSVKKRKPSRPSHRSGQGTGK